MPDAYRSKRADSGFLRSVDLSGVPVFKTLVVSGCLSWGDLGAGIGACLSFAKANIASFLRNLAFLQEVVQDSLEAMSRRREKSQRQDKFNASEMRNLIKEYGIEFRGLLTPSQWPKCYSNLFLRVRETGSTEFDKYQPDERTTRPFVDEMKRRAIELARVGDRDRRGRVNEPTLRGNTEPLVFARFGAEVKW
jgi:hypothetical protein